METRASEQTASDLSYYTGGDSRASRSQAIDDLFRKYQSDGVEGTSAELRKKAEADFNALQDSKLGGVDSQGNRTGPGSSGGSGGGQAKPKDPTSTISETVKAILDHIKSSLPQHALSA
jgi:hypothetical protein